MTSIEKSDSVLPLARLVPRLDGLGWRVLEPIVPGTEPLESLEGAIGDVAEPPPSPQFWGNRTDVAGLLTGNRGSDDSQSPQNWGFGGHPDREKTLLIVDQFEEVFTLCRDKAAQSAFIQRLIKLPESEGIAVVVTMRADFVEACLADGDLTQAIQADAVWLGAMGEAELRSAIEQPAIVQGAQLEAGLVELILRDVAEEENCLPLLEFALFELWERRSVGGTEPNSELKAPRIGGLGPANSL